MWRHRSAAFARNAFGRGVSQKFHAFDFVLSFQTDSLWPELALALKSLGRGLPGAVKRRSGMREGGRGKRGLRGSGMRSPECGIEADRDLFHHKKPW
jgi:hypothetical protein